MDQPKVLCWYIWSISLQVLLVIFSHISSVFLRFFNLNMSARINVRVDLLKLNSMVFFLGAEWWAQPFGKSIPLLSWVPYISGESFKCSNGTNLWVWWQIVQLQGFAHSLYVSSLCNTLYSTWFSWYLGSIFLFI